MNRRAAGDTALAMIGIEESVEGTKTEQIALAIRARTSKIIVLMLVMDQSSKPKYVIRKFINYYFYRVLFLTEAQIHH